MTRFLLHLFLTALLLSVVALLVPGFQITGAAPAILFALVLGLVNAIVRPIMVILTLPLTLLTLGLFLFVVNALMLWLAATIVPGIRIDGFGSALVASLLLTVLNLTVGRLAERAATVRV